MRLASKNQENYNQFDWLKLIFQAILLWIILSPAAVFAATLPEYRENVRDARDLIYDLLYPDEETGKPAKNKVSEAEILKEIRRTLPAAEKIEWQNATVETNNQWLTDDLSNYESEAKDSPKRRQILIAAAERLEALDRNLAQLENPAANNRAKDEDKQKLAEILRREEYQKPEKQEESFFQKIYRKIAAWLAQFFPEPDLSDSTSSGYRSFYLFLQILLYALVFGVVGFLIYKFAPSLLKRFGTRQAKEKQDRVILGERIAADETAENLFAAAERLAREGKPREAIRQGYIALLCDLSDRKIIGLAKNKTNRDYLRDVQRRESLYENVSDLTANFERHWYGFAPTDARDWEEFRNVYEKTLSDQPT